MLIPLAIAGLIACWKLIEFTDDYISDCRPARRIARAASIVLAAAALLSPSTFTAATAAYVVERATEATEWMISSTQDVLEISPAPTEVSTPTSAK